MEAVWMGMSAEDDLVIRGHPFCMTVHDLEGVQAGDCWHGFRFTVRGAMGMTGLEAAGTGAMAGLWEGWVGGQGDWGFG
jgi:hypothetical protein